MKNIFRKLATILFAFSILITTINAGEGQCPLSPPDTEPVVTVCLVEPEPTPNSVENSNSNNDNSDSLVEILNDLINGIFGFSLL